MSPTVDNGIAATDCVLFSGNMSLDSKVAAANARTALALQIESSIDTLSDSTETRSMVDNNITVSSEFSNQTKQSSKLIVNSSVIKQVQVVAFNNKDYLCAMAVIDKSQTEQLVDILAAQSHVEIDETGRAKIKDRLTHSSKESLPKGFDEPK
jgi:hypothetical protein